MANYPTGDDLRARLEAGEVPSATLDKLDLGYAIASTIKDWENRTGYHPFLASIPSEPLTFLNPQCSIVELETGVVAVSSVVADGRALVEGVDYVLEPRRALKEGKPYTSINLLGCYVCLLTVTARVGYCTDIAPDVFDLILEGAGAKLGPLISAASAFVAANEGGDVKKQTTGDTTIEFAVATGEKTSAMKYEAGEWRDRYEKGAKARRLKILGLND